MLDNARKRSLTPAAARMRRLRNDGPRFYHPDLVFGFIPQKNCILCGDGIERVMRKCQLHPEICDACEREYCECEVQDVAELMALEDIARYPEEKRIPLLKARKVTLRAAGKSTTSMPNIGIQQSAEVMYVNIRRGGWREEDPWADNAKRMLEDQDASR